MELGERRFARLGRQFLMNFKGEPGKSLNNNVLRSIDLICSCRHSSISSILSNKSALSSPAKKSINSSIVNNPSPFKSAATNISLIAPKSIILKRIITILNSSRFRTLLWSVSPAQNNFITFLLFFVIHENSCPIIYQFFFWVMVHLIF